MAHRKAGDDVRMSGRIRSSGRATPDLLSPQSDGRKGVQSVDIAFLILRALEASERPMSLGEIAARVDHQPSKVHHYLVSLIRNGIVAQNSAGHYDLGPFSLQLGLSALSRIDALEQAIGAATAFRDDTGEAAFVAVWGNRGPTIIRYVEGRHPVTVEVRAGLVLPLLTSATGHIFLTWLPEARWTSIAEWETENGAAQKEIARLQDKTRQHGVATVDGDLLPRIAALSCPVFGLDGTLVCSLTALGWRGDFSLSLSGATSKSLKAAAEKLSQALGYRER